MAKEKCLFERLDDISAEQSVILTEVSGVKAKVDDTDSKIAVIEEELKKLKEQKSVAQQARPKQSEKVILQTFLKQSRKSWRWFGTLKEFKGKKALAILSLIVLLVVGLATTLISTLCFRIYSTFTFFENAWMIIGIIYLVYASKAKYIYEINALSSSSPLKYETDNVGMKFPRKEKVVFRIFKWIAIISTICNVIAIWVGMGHDYKILATVFEVLFLGAIIFVYFMNTVLFYSDYSIVWVEGYNMHTKEKVVLVLPPGAKQLMTEEQFKKMMPFFCE